MRIQQIKSFGDFAVYRRLGREIGLPRYFVLRLSDNHILEEFRRLQSAVDWADAQARTNPVRH